MRSSPVPRRAPRRQAHALRRPACGGLCAGLRAIPVQSGSRRLRRWKRTGINYAGVRCGTMDQLASSLADTARALLLDTRTLERRFVPLPPGSSVLVLDSGVCVLVGRQRLQPAPSASRRHNC